ncbi:MULTISPECIES: ATP-binding cassette domain-containing protein [unclassified Pseudofrankia]|uniref:ATP-binding cassette domain-containing protein n=1 Tax=unclassified Pseudofrankia TaxID=2994372 RepID=UPI0009F4B0CA|nr:MULTISPECIES: ATP-binding cassette domain-containing protein [unclassified Pseudofrankia]MDT3441440.1 ATP-binding cassette domain-containing protein [Pseudofrankia sp. BMG5.37]
MSAATTRTSDQTTAGTTATRRTARFHRPGWARRPGAAAGPAGTPVSPSGGEKLLEAIGLGKTFGNGVRAVDDVSLTVGRGETVGIVGESGSGKSTTAKMILGLLAPDEGDVFFDGVPLRGLPRARMRALRARLQVVPQNPQTSLNPRLTVRSSIEFNLRAHGAERVARRTIVPEMLERVGLTPTHAERFPHELSGGQLQRVAIARALATRPDLVVCDEAVSALDKSVQAQVLNLLAELQADLGVSFLFISHDLAVVEHIADQVTVMYLGRVVEQGPAAQLWTSPRHEYTRALLAATPGRALEEAAGRDRPMIPVQPSGADGGAAGSGTAATTGQAAASRPPG